jgi:hypothetical protein
LQTKAQLHYHVNCCQVFQSNIRLLSQKLVKFKINISEHKYMCSRRNKMMLIMCAGMVCVFRLRCLKSVFLYHEIPKFTFAWLFFKFFLLLQYIKVFKVSELNDVFSIIFSYLMFIFLYYSIRINPCHIKEV